MHATNDQCCNSRYWTRRTVCSRRRSRPGNSVRVPPRSQPYQALLNRFEDRLAAGMDLGLR